MSADRFVVFVRTGSDPWAAIAALDNLGLAIHEGDHLVGVGEADAAVVMEVSGTDAMPMFTYRYGTKR